MKSKLFGKNITPGCAYCDNAFFSNGALGCKKSKQIKNEKCRSFSYNPLLRVPKSLQFSAGSFTAEDFKL